MGVGGEKAWPILSTPPPRRRLSATSHDPPQKNPPLPVSHEHQCGPRGHAHHRDPAPPVATPLRGHAPHRRRWDRWRRSSPRWGRCRGAAPGGGSSWGRGQASEPPPTPDWNPQCIPVHPFPSQFIHPSALPVHPSAPRPRPVHPSITQCHLIPPQTAPAISQIPSLPLPPSPNASHSPPCPPHRLPQPSPSISQVWLTRGGHRAGPAPGRLPTPGPGRRQQKGWQGPGPGDPAPCPGAPRNWVYWEALGGIGGGVGRALGGLGLSNGNGGDLRDLYKLEGHWNILGGCWEGRGGLWMSWKKS